MADITFEWDHEKDVLNQCKHKVSFATAQEAFFDLDRVVARDVRHSSPEERYFCIGRVAGGIMTVRFTYRGKAIRIIGAGYWRKGKQIYEEENRIHR